MAVIASLQGSVRREMLVKAHCGTSPFDLNNERALRPHIAVSSDANRTRQRMYQYVSECISVITPMEIMSDCITHIFILMEEGLLV